MKHKTMEKKSLRVMYLEDSPRDIEIIREQLIEAGFDLSMDCIEKKEEFVASLQNVKYDVILSDFKLPGFDAFGALRLSLEICPEVPFICVSGSIGEETAIELIKQGAVDYVLKDRMIKLPSAVKRAINEAKEKETRHQAEEALHESEERYRLLFDSSMDAVLLTSPAGDIFSANPAACKMFGRTEKEICAIGRKGIVDVSDPRLAVALEERARTGRFICELAMFRKDGTTFPAEISSAIFKDKDGRDRSSMIIRDVTERKQVQEKLNTLAHALRSISECVSITDTDNTVLFVNEAFLKTYGYEEHEVLGRNIDIVWSPKNPPDTMPEILPETLRGRWHGEILNRRKDGSDFPISLSTSIVADNKGQVIALVGVATDITERKRVEEALRSSEERYRLISTVASDYMFSTRVGASGELVLDWVAGAFEQITGYTFEEYVARGGWRAALHPDDLAADNRDLEKLRANQPVITELRTIMKGGDTVWVRVYAHPVWDTVREKLVGIFGAVQDITERKRTEESVIEREKRYRTLFDLSPAGIMLEDTAGNILDVNDALCRTLGYSREALIGKNVRALTPSDRHAIIDPHIAEVLSGKVLEHEVDNIGKDGSMHRMELRETLVPLPGNKQGILVVSTDITERKKAEKALRESEKRYHSLFDGMMDGVYRSTHEGRFVDVNPAMVNMFGFASKEEMLKADIKKELYFDPSERESLFMDTGQERIEIFRMRHKDGSEIWVEDHGSYVHDEKGNIVFHEGILRDVTARLVAEDALKKSEEKYKDIFTWAPVGIYQSTIEGKIVTANKSLANILGYDAAEDLINRDMAKDIYYYEKERQKVIKQYENGKQGSVANIELLWKKKDGTPVWIMLTTHAIRDKNGKMIYFEGFVYDCTERKRAEENVRRLSAAIEQSPASIVITDLEGKIEYVNPKFTQVTGFTAAEALGQNSRILKSGEKQSEEYKQLWETITTGKEWRGEFHNKKKNGELYWESASISPIKDATGKTTHYLAVKEDITERKSLEAQLLRMQRMESIGTLAGGVAHDLNNVLTPIMLSIEILRKAMVDEQSRKMLETLATSAKRGSTIVKQILSFARGVRGESVHIQFRHIINEITNIIKETFPKSITITEDIPRDIWTIVGDPTSLHQLTLNLCLNARDAMPGGGTLYIKAENIVIDEHFCRVNLEAKPGRFVMLGIEDTGCGMPPSVLEHIFEPFFTTKAVGKGTGLGLTTVHAIVKSHGGFVKVYSEVGKGTTFRIYLPAAMEARDLRPMMEESPKMRLGHGELIMVVDDESSVQQITKQTLETYGYRVITASDGTEALTHFAPRKDEIALVLTDMVMPTMDGPRTIQVLRRIKPTVKIIASSGLTGDGRVAIDEELGVDAFLVKPYNAEKLLEIVHSVLHKS